MIVSSPQVKIEIWNHRTILRIGRVFLMKNSVSMRLVRIGRTNKHMNHCSYVYDSILIVKMQYENKKINKRKPAGGKYSRIFRKTCVF